MSTSDSLRRLADWISAFETAGFSVSELKPVDGTVVRGSETVADLSLEMPCCTHLVEDDAVELTPKSARVTEDGRIVVELTLGISDEATPPAAESMLANGATTDRSVADGETGVESEATDTPEIGPEQSTTAVGSEPESNAGLDGNEGTGSDLDPDRATGAGDEPDQDGSAGDEATDVADETPDPGGETDDPPTPVHRDPEKLQEVYAPDHTFEEMRDALGADVTPQTVRKHMIKHGIHEPESRSRTIIAAAKSGDETDGDEGTTDDRDVDGQTAADAAGDDPVDADAPTDSTGDPTDAGNDDAAERVSGAPDSDDDEAANQDGDFDDRVVADDLSPAETVDGAPEERDGENGNADSPEPRGESVDDVEFEAVSDGIGLPEDLTMTDLREAVHGGRTLEHVRRRLDVDRDTTRDLLQKLNLLELVTGRMASRDQVDRSMEEIDRRIREATGNLEPA